MSKTTYSHRVEGRLIWRDIDIRENSAGMVLEPIRGAFLPCHPHGRTAGIDFYRTPDGGLVSFSSEAAAWEYIETRRAAEAEAAQAGPYAALSGITLDYYGRGAYDPPRCLTCGGTGVDAASFDVCPRCGGTGEGQ